MSYAIRELQSNCTRQSFYLAHFPTEKKGFNRSDKWKTEFSEKYKITSLNTQLPAYGEPGLES